MNRLGPTLATAGQIVIQGAREHNLKNLSLTIPRNQFVVITGVSGSGKSTLAFDLLFAEGQRRFLDALNTYARQYVEQLSRPDVDLIAGIPPTVSIEQRISHGGGKSTVATVTEIYHFLRLLFARLGVTYCPDCQLPVGAQTRDELGRRLRSEAKRRGDLWLLAPVIKNRKGFHSEIAVWAAEHGYNEIRADGKIYNAHEPFRLDRFREHDVEIVVGGLAGKPAHVTRSNQFPQNLVDEALKLGHGTVYALDQARHLTVHSTERACPQCGRSFEPLDPKMLSYNSPRGWCPTCRGFGELFYLPEVDRGARAEAIEESWFSWQEGERELCPDCHGMRLNPLARAIKLTVGDDLVSPGQTATKARRSAFELVTEPTLDTFARMDVTQAMEWFGALKLKGREAEVARDILPEIRDRLKFLANVGLSYLQLGRGITTLSSGEAQRIRLAAQLGSNLSGVLYILDEPTIGLHARDNEQLLKTLGALRARGNSLVVVEHDEATMRRADCIIDLGPGAGINGGRLVASGTLRELMRHPASLTGQSLRQKKDFPSRGQRRTITKAASTSPRTAPFSGPVLTLRGARRNNLKNLTVTFPLNCLVLVTGVSGSGKSTLVRECLLPALKAQLLRGEGQSYSGKKVERDILAQAPSSIRIDGCQHLRSVYEVDQNPIGRTPRSVPATYVGFFDAIRQVFSQVPEARLRGYTPSRFSFNSAQGRCPACAGAGVIKMEMNFLPPAFVRCETCEGTRFNRETLDIVFHDKNIAQVLDLSVAEALEFFASFQTIGRPLAALRDTGLDYLKLGQTSPTLSGGEAQRLKLVTHLLSGFRQSMTDIRIGESASDQEQATHVDPPTATGEAPLRAASSERGANVKAWKRRGNLFLLEEPTIGLHSADVRRLVEVLQRLIDAGHSVIVIEHNLELIAEADWVIDLGPEGGAAGGRIVAEGTPEQIAQNKDSHTGSFLYRLLTKP